MIAWWNSIHVVGRDKRIRATAGIPGLTKGNLIAVVNLSFLNLLRRFHRWPRKRLSVDRFYNCSHLCKAGTQTYFTGLVRILSEVSVRAPIKVVAKTMQAYPRWAG